MGGISAKKFRDSANKIVEENYRDSHWKVFDFYALNGQPESRYLYAPRATAENVPNGSWYLEPLSRGNAGLFLEFSNWPVEYGMDKAIETVSGVGPTFDTQKNAAAAIEWAVSYGVLGLGTNQNEEHSIGSSPSLSQVTARYTGLPALGGEVGRAYRKSPRGGIHETVTAFAFEAWQAYLVRRLYEMASRKILDEVAIVHLMDDTPRGYWLPSRWQPRTERETWSEDPWSIRRWALGIVEEAVMRKVENDCHPTLELASGDWPVSYKQGWGTKSLLGAMWLQMMWLMVGEDNTCEWCGNLLEPTRKDKRFCDNRGLCKSKWNYHLGTGKSNKQARKRERTRQGATQK